MSKITVVRENGNSVVLTDKQFLAAGGEGSVYKNQGIVYKIYTDVSKNYDWLEKKVKLLAPLASANSAIVAPTRVIRSPAGKIVGYEMPFVTGIPLVTTFANSWWTANGFDFSKALSVVRHMRDLVEAAHKGGALLVDGNEMNYLLKGEEPYVIDVDSWQIGEFKATAIMPSIADYKAGNSFTELTDWFAWGIVTFQLWTGLHPYRGLHPKYKKGDMIGRMRDHVSLFDSEATYPAAIRDFTNIPPALLAWYQAVFQKGERLPPPDSRRGFVEPVAVPVPTQVVHKTVQVSGGHLTLSRLIEAQSSIVRVLTGNLLVLADGLYRLKNGNLDKYLAFSLPAEKYSVMVDERTGKIVVFDPITTKGPISYSLLSPSGKLLSSGQTPISANFHYSCDSRVFAVQDSGIDELDCLFTPANTVVVGSAKKWPVLSNSFIPDYKSGAGIFFAIGGVAFSVLPVGKTGFIIAPLPQLNGKRVVRLWGQAPFFCCISLERDGTYMKHEFFLTSDGSVVKYWQSVTDWSDLNIALTRTGVVVTVVQDGEMVLFSSSSSNVRKVSDSRIKLGSPLFNVDGKMSMVEGASLWDISLT